MASLQKPRPHLLLKRAWRALQRSDWHTVRKAVLQRDQWTCRACGKTANDVHHVIFRSLGGTDEANNLIAVCRICHDDIHGHILKVRWRDDQQPERTVWFEWVV